jgi:hypothetical protein
VSHLLNFYRLFEWAAKPSEPPDQLKGATNMKKANLRLKLIALIALVAIATAGIVIRARAQTDTTLAESSPVARFGLMGITRGQTARLTLSNVSSPDDHFFPPDPCRVIITFVDADGNVLLNSADQPVRRDVTLDPGHSASVQINGDNLVSRDQTRLSFRPVVRVFVSTNSDGTTPPDPCFPTLEVINNTTGRTTLLNPGTPFFFPGNHNETLLRDK